ncbi:preprotein translocase subunit SecG [bacterium]|nr:preprotein translocase subunit SecG [bacterium]
MYTSIVILVVIASVLMCLIVLIQESKGGGLAADYSNNNQILGAPKTSNFIEKATWGLAIFMIVLSVISVAFLPSTTASDSVLLQEATEQAATNPNNVPGMAQPSAPEAPAETPVQ